VSEDGREFATTPLGREGAVRQGVFVDETIEVLLQLARDLGGATGAWTIPQALGPLLRKALHPFPQGRIRQVEGRGDSRDMMPHNHRTDSLGTAKDPRLLGLLEHGV
jgi:hypothetical protein